MSERQYKPGDEVICHTKPDEAKYWDDKMDTLIGQKMTITDEPYEGIYLAEGFYWRGWWLEPYRQPKKSRKLQPMAPLSGVPMEDILDLRAYVNQLAETVNAIIENRSVNINED